MIMKLLLQNGAEVNAEGGKYGNALQAASFRGNSVIVKLLLENGAEVNAKGGMFGNALQAALYIHNEAIVKLLLENGAEVNAEGGVPIPQIPLPKRVLTRIQATGAFAFIHIPEGYHMDTSDW